MHRRRTVSRAWTALLWGVVGWFGVQLLWGIALDVSSAEHLDPEYARRERQLLDRVAEYPDRPLVLTLGSSRTILALQAGRLTSSSTEPAVLVFNFGLTGAGPQLERLALHRLRERGVCPALLLVEVLPPLFNAPHGPDVEAFWLKGERLRISELAAIAPHHSRHRRLLTEWVRSRLLPGDLKRDQFVRLTHLEPPGEPMPFDEDGHGWFGHRLECLPDADRQRLLAAAYAQYRTTFGDFHPATASVEGLQTILNEARSAGIPTALFVLPEAKEFQAFYAPGHIPAFDAFLAEFARQQGVALVNARDWVPDHGFLDGHHLLAEGAVAFTLRFEREALRPLLRDLPATPQFAAEMTGRSRSRR